MEHVLLIDHEDAWATEHGGEDQKSVSPVAEDNSIQPIITVSLATKTVVKWPSAYK